MAAEDLTGPAVMREEAVLADRIEARAYADLYDAAPEALKARLGLRVERIGPATALVAPGLPVPLFNRAIGVGTDGPAAIRDIERLRGLYREAGVRRWWLHWSPCAEPADGHGWLAPLGFTVPPRRRWAQMQRATARPPQPHTDLGVGLALPAQVGETVTSIASAFGMPPVMADWLAALHGRPAWRLYAITDGARTVGGAGLFIDGDTAWLGLGAVLPSHRRRGGQGAAMARRIADAGAAGCSRVATETGEPVGDEANPSLDNMRRNGFRLVASRLNFEFNEPG